MVDQTMDALKTALGEETYNRLDKWIVATWGPHTSIILPGGSAQPARQVSEMPVNRPRAETVISRDGTAYVRA